MKRISLFLLLLCHGAIQAQNCTFCHPDHVAVGFHASVSMADAGKPRSQYSVAELLPLVSKIATEFKTVVVGLLDILAPTYDGWEIEAVATWNAQKVQSSPALNCILVLMSFNPGKDADYFHHLRRIVNRSNAIYPGSVTTLVLMPVLEPSEIPVFHADIQAAQQYFPSPDFVLGVAGQLKSFENLMALNHTLLIEATRRTFEQVDLALFYIEDLAQVSANISVSTIVQDQLELVRENVKLVMQSSDHSLQVGVFAYWPDTNEDGAISYQRQVQFWQEIIQAGKAKNLSIFLGTAFDYVAYETGVQSTTGWWRLVENSSYANSSQFIFENKFSLALKEKRVNINQTIEQVERVRDFKRARISVEVSSNLLLYQQSYSNIWASRGLPSLLETIVSRFNSLHVVYNHLETNVSGVGQPKAVALHNQQNPDNKRLQFQMQLHSHSEKSVQFCMDLVTEANDIYPGTVDMITIYKPNLPIVQNMSQALALNAQRDQVRLCVLYMIKSCRELGTHPNISMGLDCVFFSYVIGLRHVHKYSVGVDRVLNQVIWYMETCQKAMNAKYPGVEVGFELGYPSYHQDYVGLVTFWNRIGDWSIKTKTPLKYTWAFELCENLKELQCNLGWWKLENPGPTTPVFVEKRTVALQKLKESMPKRKVQKQEEPWTPLTLALICVAVIIGSVVLLSGTFFVSRRFSRPAQKGSLRFTNPDVHTGTLVLPGTAFAKESSSLIGAGKFGTVYKCWMSQFSAEVAVKIPVEDASSPQFENSVKSLIAEIKILSFVEKHEHILTLLGYSQDATLFIVTEYCENGSLLLFLRNGAQGASVLSRYNLLKYSLEITKGLECLHSMQVIHGDLSARNVLLDRNCVCKVSDFGLSRKLEQYDKYIKAGSEPLPWRWMSVEALSKMEFSTMSDVWSLGVTFWEIFTLGNIPFLGVTWDSNLCTKLSQGLRLNKPELCDEAIYGLMLRCWKLKPGKRPTSAVVRQRLANLQTGEYALF